MKFLLPKEILCLHRIDLNRPYQEGQSPVQLSYTEKTENTRNKRKHRRCCTSPVTMPRAYYTTHQAARRAGILGSWKSNHFPFSQHVKYAMRSQYAYAKKSMHAPFCALAGRPRGRPVGRSTVRFYNRVQLPTSGQHQPHQIRHK